jgi:hypothetical protein
VSAAVPADLGRRDAVIQFARPDDTPRRACLTGRPAARYKEFVSSSPPTIYRMSAKRILPAVFLAPRGGRATRSQAGASPAPPGS